MLKGMTGFGRAVATTPVGQFEIEISTVNRKHLEVRSSLPPLLQEFERNIRQWVGEAIRRGQVTISIRLTVDSDVKVSLNLPMMHKVKEVASVMATELAIDNGQAVELAFREARAMAPLLTQEIESTGKVRDELKKCITSALQGVNEMRESEGKTVSHDLLERAALLETAIDAILADAPNAVEKQKKKLHDRLADYAALSDHDEKLAREIALYAERVDISEELTRFRHHLKRFQDQVGGTAVMEGRRIEFVCQELQREINTIGAKASDVAIADRVIEVKGELEKIREQVQNAE